METVNDKRKNKTDLIAEARISSTALAKLGRNEHVSLVVVDKICQFLECDISDVVTIEKKKSPGGLFYFCKFEILYLFA